jgi:hypothetical protein
MDGGSIAITLSVVVPAAGGIITLIRLNNLLTRTQNKLDISESENRQRERDIEEKNRQLLEKEHQLREKDRKIDALQEHVKNSRI